MQVLNLPKYEFRIKRRDDNYIIFDVLRKKWIRMTPEEWVRQNFIRFLIDLGYPASSIAVEVGVTINGRKLRADALIYDNKGQIKLLLEFKSPQVDIDESTFAQAADYNTKVVAPYIIISNGISHFCVKIENGKIIFQKELPNYAQICL